MSKIKGNVLNPINTLEEYGTDALRFAVITGTSPGNDSKLTPTKLEAGRNFANKLWNATRFVVRSIGTDQTDMDILRDSLPTEDRWILSRLNQTVASVTGLLEDFQFAEAQRQIYDFLWGEYCDWYIEFAKIRLAAGEPPSPVPVLVRVLETSLRLLHPYMPFVTEELWQHLKNRLAWPAESIVIAPYPEADRAAADPIAEDNMAALIEIIRSIRNIRAQYKVESGRWIEAQIHAGSALRQAITPYAGAIQTLARARPVTFPEGEPQGKTGDNTLVLALAQATVVIPLASMVDLETERKRLQKEIDQSQSEVTRLEARLNDQNFLTRAPAAVIEKERQKLYTLTDKLERLKQQIPKL